MLPLAQERLKTTPPSESPRIHFKRPPGELQCNTSQKLKKDLWTNFPEVTLRNLHVYKENASPPPNSTPQQMRLHDCPLSHCATTMINASRQPYRTGKECSNVDELENEFTGVRNVRICSCHTVYIDAVSNFGLLKSANVKRSEIRKHLPFWDLLCLPMVY